MRVERLRGLDVATVHEAAGRVGELDPRIRPIQVGTTIAGTAVTARCHPGDNLAIHHALLTAEPGAVLVVAAGGHLAGYWGELLAVAAQHRGIAGLVIDGGVRDVSALEAHGFPVFSSMIALRGATKQLAGGVGGHATVGDVVVHEGDWIVADADGVTVVPHTKLDDVLAAGRAREAKEAGFFETLRAGKTTIELLGLDTTPITRD